LPGCEAPGDLAILLDGLSINGRPIAPDFEGSDMHLAETICCDSTTSEITVGLAGGNLPAAAEVTEAAPHLSSPRMVNP